MYTQPLHPDELNDVLSEPSIDFGVDEATEREVRSTLNDMANRMGHERFAEFGMRFLLEMEPRLRQTLPANNPAIRALDEYHLLHG